MKNLLALFGFALVLFLSVGYYRNWYSFSLKPGAQDGHQTAEFDINKKKIADDAATAGKTVGEKIHNLTERDKK